MDTTIMFFAVILLLVSSACLAAYLLFERGSIFDPVATFWAGYILYIPLAMMAVSVYYASRRTEEMRVEGAVLACAGTLMYILGLYSGRGKNFAKRLPLPAPVLGQIQIFVMWMVCFSLLGLAFGSAIMIGAAWRQVIAGIVSGVIGAAALLSVLGFFTYRGNPFAQLLMAAGVVFIAFMLINLSWSRRPLAGLVLAAFGFIYVFRMRFSAPSLKVALLVSIGVSTGVLLLFLTATRGERFYGSMAGRADTTFSANNFKRFVGGLDINYVAYEFTLQQFPTNRDFLWGSGYVTTFLFFIPRAIWEDKPIATGNLVSRMWFGTNDLPNTLGLPPFGELYANFTVIGVIVGMYISGRVVRIANTYLHDNENNVVLWLAWLMSLPDFASIWRGDFTAMVVSPATQVTVFLFLAWASGKFFPKQGASNAAIPKNPRAAYARAMPQPVAQPSPLGPPRVGPPQPWVPGYLRPRPGERR